MRCVEMEELISAYANGELAQEPREQVEQHLSGCVDCQEKLANYQRVRQQLETLRVAPEAPDIRASMISRIKSSKSQKRPVSSWRRRVLIAVPVIAVLIVLLIAQPWGSFTTPGKIIVRAHTAMESLTSYRLSITRIDDPEGVTSIFEAEFTAPDRYRLKQSVNGEEQEIIVLGDEQYYRSDTFAYLKPQARLYSMMLTREAALEWLDMLADIRELPEETLNGASCLHYLGAYDYAKDIRQQQDERINIGLPPLSVKELEQRVKEYRSKSGERNIEVWIGKDDYLLRQIKMDTQRTSETGKIVSSRGTYRFFDFNQTITIEDPLDSSGKLLPDWSSTVPEQPAFDKKTRVNIDNFDPQNRTIRYSVILTNISGETLKGLNVNVLNDSTFTRADMHVRITGGPVGPSLYVVAPDESLSYEIAFIYNASMVSQVDSAGFVSQSFLQIGYLSPNGQQKLESVHFTVPDSIYNLPTVLPSISDLSPVAEYRVEEPEALSAGHSVSGQIDGRNYLFVMVNPQDSEAPASRGILVLDIQDLTKPVRVAYLKTAESTRYLINPILSGTVLYIPAENFLWLIDVSNPSSPRELAKLAQVKPFTVAISGKYAYINDENQKITTVDISDPSQPQVIGSLQLTSSSSISLDISGGYLLAWTGDQLHTINISSPQSLRIVNTYTIELPANSSDSPSLARIRSKAISGDYAYVSLVGEGGNGITVIDISNPASPAKKAFLELKDRQLGDLFISGNRAYIFTRAVIDISQRLELIDISNPAQPAVRGFGRLPDYWDFFDKVASGSYPYSYYSLNNYLYWFIGNPPNQPVIEVFDLSGS
jgi:hypothetical protein